MDETVSGASRRGTWDGCIEQLQALRASVGSPAYAEIANRIAAKREADGVSPHAARVARSSVFDAFRQGRARINVGFLKEIVAALGADPELVDEWVRACYEPPQVRRLEHSGEPPEPGPEPPEAPSTRAVLLLMAGCLLLNLAGRVLVDSLSLTIYLDMVGTAIAAIALGPWKGAVVGAATNVVGVAISGPDSLPFTVVNVAGALAWGYGVRRWRLGRTLPHFFWLSLLTAWACSAVAVPILLVVFGQSAPLGDNAVTRAIIAPIHSYVVALTASNLLTSTIDKLLSGFIALVAVASLPRPLRAGVELVGVPEPP